MIIEPTPLDVIAGTDSCQSTISVSRHFFAHGKKFVPLVHVTEIRKGCSQFVFQRQPAPDELCMSVHYWRTSLKLQCRSVDERDRLVATLEAAVAAAQNEARLHWLNPQSNN